MSVPLQPSLPPQQIASPPVTVILTVILLAFFFVGFFFIYFCRCFMQNLIYSWHLRNGPSGNPVGPTAAEANPGLDPSIISTFPTFTYSSVKEFRKEKYGLECAICLCEFEDDNVLRLLTKCYHVFHQQCIDLWLESHKSCPFCRRGLETPVNSPEKSPESQNSSSMHEIHENESLEGYTSHNINIKDENDNIGNEREESDNDNYKAATNEVIITVEQDPVDKKNERFTRSNSTGHSIASNTKTKCIEEEDRFTLKLPEHIQAKIIRGHNWTRSCTTFGEYKSKTSTGSGGFGEVSAGEVSKV